MEKLGNYSTEKQEIEASANQINIEELVTAIGVLADLQRIPVYVQREIGRRLASYLNQSEPETVGSLVASLEELADKNEGFRGVTLHLFREIR